MITAVSTCKSQDFTYVKASVEYMPPLTDNDSSDSIFFPRLNIFIDFLLSVRADRTFAASGLNVSKHSTKLISSKI